MEKCGANIKAKKKGCENDSNVHVVRDSNLHMSRAITSLSGHITIVFGAQVSIIDDVVNSSVIDVVLACVRYFWRWCNDVIGVIAMNVSLKLLHNLLLVYSTRVRVA